MLSPTFGCVPKLDQTTPNELLEWVKVATTVSQLTPSIPNAKKTFCRGEFQASYPSTDPLAHSIITLPSGGKLYLTSSEGNDDAASFWEMASKESFHAAIFHHADGLLQSRKGNQIHVRILELPGSPLCRFRVELYHPSRDPKAKCPFIRSFTLYVMDRELDRKTALDLGAENLPGNLSFVSSDKNNPDLGSLIRCHLLTQIAALPGDFSLDLPSLDRLLENLLPGLGSNPSVPNQLAQIISCLPHHLRPLLFHGIQFNEKETPFCSPHPDGSQIVNDAMRHHPKWAHYQALNWDPVWEDRTRAKGYGPYPDNRFLCEGGDYRRPDVFWMHEPKGDFKNLRNRCRAFHSPTDAVRRIRERSIEVIVQIGSHCGEHPWIHEPVELIQLPAEPSADSAEWKRLTGRRVMVVFRETLEPFINASVIPTGHLTTQFPITPEELEIASISPVACPELDNKFPTTEEFRLMVRDSKAKIIVLIGKDKQLYVDGLDQTIILIDDLADTDAVIEALEQLSDIRGPEPVIVLSETGSILFVAADLIFQIGVLRAELGKEWSLDLVALLKWLSLPPYGRANVMSKTAYQILTNLVERHKDP